jgi:hypothetical protein
MFQKRENKEDFTRVQYSETRLEPIWDCLVSILKDPCNVIPKLEEYTFKSDTEKNAREKIQQSDKQIESIESQRIRIVTAFVDGGLEEKDYKEQLNECNSRISQHQNQKKKWEQMLVKREVRKDRNEILNGLYEKIKQRLETADYDDKRYILHLFVERINLFHKNNYAEVFFKFPTSTNVKLDEGINVISHQDDLHLILHVKTLSERERSQEIMVSGLNNMYTKKSISKN